MLFCIPLGWNNNLVQLMFMRFILSLFALAWVGDGGRSSKIRSIVNETVISAVLETISESLNQERFQNTLFDDLKILSLP